MTFEIQGREAIPSQRFDAFEIGDVVVSESTMVAGIKIGPTQIRLADRGLTTMVDPSQTFLIPAKIIIRVTL